MRYFDGHIHLDRYTDNEVIHFIDQSDLVGMIAVSTNLASSRRTLSLKRKYPQKIFAACGFHPEQPIQTVDSLEQFINDQITEIDAIGEVGLPYYTHTEHKAMHENILRRMLRLAHRWRKPVILHAVREDVSTLYDLLQEYEVQQAHFHWVKADPDTLDLLASKRYYVSFTPDIWYKKETAEIAASYPLDYLMAETDGPWEFEGPFAGMRTTPQMIKSVIERLAVLRQMAPNQLAQQLIKNSRSFLERSITNEDDQ